MLTAVHGSMGSTQGGTSTRKEKHSQKCLSKIYSSWICHLLDNKPMKREIMHN